MEKNESLIKDIYQTIEILKKDLNKNYELKIGKTLT